MAVTKLTQEQLQQIYAWWDIFQHGGRDFTEIRILANYTHSGYYRHIENLVRDVEENQHKGGVYFVINAPHSACYDKSQKERMLSDKNIKTTSDNEILGYRYVFIDLDCERPTDTNSTDEEKAYAKAKALEIYDFLMREGFSEPIVIDSSNGYHLYIPCRLQNTPDNKSLVENFLKAMGMLFSDERVHIDTKCANQSRIAKLPGTFSKKGSEYSTDRPQRMCKFVKVPEVVKETDRTYFEKVANMIPRAEPTKYNNYSATPFDLEDFISRHNIPVRQRVRAAGGTRYILEHCLFNENHKGKDAMLFRYDDGAIAYFCFHASCQDKHWQQVREMYEPGCYDKEFGYRGSAKENRNRRELPQPVKPQEETEEKGKKWRRMSDIARPKFDPNDYIPSGFNQLDSLIVGFKKKQVSIWSGLRGSAKSTLLNQIILNAANLGYRSALWTGELDAKDVKLWLYLQAAGKQYNKPSHYNKFFYTPEEVSKKIDPWIDNYLLLYNNEYSDAYSSLEEEIRKVVKEEKVDLVFLDNLTILDIDDLDGDQYLRQKNLIKRLTRLASELEIHIHLVAHPNKSMGFLRANSISGTGNLPDLAHNVFIIHRINQDFENQARNFFPARMVDDILASRCTNLIEVCKCRDKGAATGEFIKLFFEPESNRLKDSFAEHIRYGWEEEGTALELDMGGDLPASDNEWKEASMDFSGADPMDDLPF